MNTIKTGARFLKSDYLPALGGYALLIVGVDLDSYTGSGKWISEYLVAIPGEEKPIARRIMRLYQQDSAIGDHLPCVETELNHLTNLACVDFHRKVGEDAPCPGVGDPLTKAQLTAMKIAGRVPCDLHWIGSHTLIPGIRSMAEECDHHPKLLRDDEEYELA